MPFSASTCITNVGTTPIGSVLSAYTDFDTYVVPFTSVNVNQITGSSCPYIFTNIPNGATIIKLIDPTTNCCFTIPIQSADFCSTCDLDFNYYPLITNSQILAGELTGNCSNINSYKINWLGPNNTTNIAFTSGKGSDFTYSFTHPLTGSSFIFAQAGIYTPVIDRVKLSGYTFSNTGGTGTYDVNLNCFTAQTVQVLPLNCNNGNLSSGNYTHGYYFSGTGASSVPLDVTFELSASTNFFAVSFTGAQIPDTLKIIYSGSNTSPNRLLLENISVGSNNTNNSLSIALNSLNPQNFNGTNIKKLFCLTGLTRSAGDNLNIQLIPNSGNTEWALSLKCYSGDSLPSTVSCMGSCLSNYRNSPYRIVKSSITVTTATCYTNISYSLSGCNVSQVSADTIYKYVYNPINYNTDNYNMGYTNSCLSNYSNGYITKGIGSERLSFVNSNINSGNLGVTVNSSYCDTTNPAGTIFYSKYVSGSPQVGVIDIVASDPLYINKYYQSYLNKMATTQIWNLSACTGQPYPNYTLYQSGYYYGPFSGGSWTGGTLSPYNNTDYRYYRSLSISFPTASGSTQCFLDTPEGGGSGVPGWPVSTYKFRQYYFHTSSLVTTGITGSNYYMRIIMNPMSYGLNLTPCQIQNASIRDYFVYAINDSSTGTSNNISFTSSTASMFNSTINFYFGLNTVEYCTPASSFTHSSQFRLANYQDITMTYNTNTGNNITQYSGSVCADLVGTIPYIQQRSPSSTLFTNGMSATYFLAQYAEVLLPTGLNANNQGKDFIIYGKNINGFYPTDNSVSNYPAGSWQTAYIYTAGTQQYCDPTFVIGC